MNTDVVKALDSLKTNRFDSVKFAEDTDSAKKLILGMIPQEAYVGVPGSVTVRQIGLVEQLKARGTNVIDLTKTKKFTFEEIARQSLNTDILLSSSNALTHDGKIVNIDGIGNRLAGMVFGSKRVILVIGINKIVPNLQDAIRRIKEVIAPYHAKAQGVKTPCAINGYCTDCKSPERICNIIMAIEKRPKLTNIAVVLVGKDLGLGWDPNWSRERRERITKAYLNTRKKFSINA